MLDFTFFTPTKVFFGKDKHKEIGKIIKEYGFTKIMMQYGKSSIKKSGLYDIIVDAIRAEGTEIVLSGKGLEQGMVEIAGKFLRSHDIFPPVSAA